MSEKEQGKVLHFKDLSVGYGKVTIADGIDFTINKGEFFGLIGLNGEGKTTLIKTILDLRQQQKGDILIFGEDKATTASKSHVAYLPERFEPPWFLSGMEFLKFSLKLYGQEFHEEKMYEAAEKLALDPKALKRRVQTYSKGMRQKLGILGTVLTNCDLLILDEPMSGLDPKARTHVKDMLVETKNKDNTIFLSSHILADMDEICDRIAVLHQGKIRYVGTPADLKKQTKSKNLERAFLHYIEKDKAA